MTAKLKSGHYDSFKNSNKVMETPFLEEFKRSWLTSLIGVAAFFTGVWLLTWNEGRAVHHAHSLEEAYNNVIPLNSFEPLRPELNGRLVHVTGTLLVDEPLTEPEYGIAIQAVKLKRRVQMYQWVEQRTQTNYGDATTFDNSYNSYNDDYYYVTEWRDKLVDSSAFYIRHGHQNPTHIPLKSHVYVSHSVRIGPLSLGPELKDKFTDYVEVTSDERPDRHDIKLHLGIYYHCDDVWNPEVGDIRVQFYYAGVAGEPVSIVAEQKDDKLVPYVTSKGHLIALLRHGVFGIPEMFNAEHSDIRFTTWKLRGVGLFILYASTVCLARLLRILMFRSLLFRRILSSEITSSANLAVAFSVSLFVVASAWMFYRPMLGFGLFMASVSPFLYSTMGLYNGAQNQNGYYNR